MTGSVDKGRVVTVDYLDFSEAIGTLPLQHILIEKLRTHELDKLTENCLNCWTQGPVLRSTKSSWRQVTSDLPHGLILRPLLFNIFINDQNDVADWTLCKPVGNLKLGGVFGSPGGCGALHRDLDNLDKWVYPNVMKFYKGKDPVPMEE